jgi:hypothetical protein
MQEPLGFKGLISNGRFSGGQYSSCESEAIRVTWLALHHTALGFCNASLSRYG